MRQIIFLSILCLALPIIAEETPPDQQPLPTVAPAPATDEPADPAPAISPAAPAAPIVLRNQPTLPEADLSYRQQAAERQKLFYQNYFFTLHAFAGATMGARLTLGTLRWEHFQMEIACGGGGANSADAELKGGHISFYLIGLGGKWAVSVAGEHEIGFMIGTLGAGITTEGGDRDQRTTRVEWLPTRVGYRYHMTAGTMLEAGISFPLIYARQKMHDHHANLYGGIPNFQFYFGFGY